MIRPIAPILSVSLQDPRHKALHPATPKAETIGVNSVEWLAALIEAAKGIEGK